MIDKRINYQWGGPGGKSPGTSASGGTRGGGGGGNGRSRALQQIAAKAPAPAPKGERKNPFEETGQTKIEQEKIAKNVQELQDKVKELKEKYPLQKDEFDDPEFYVDLDKYMEDKDLYSSDDEEDWAFEDLKAKVPTTLTPRTKTIDQGVPHLEDPIEKTVPHYYGGIGSKTTYGFGPKGTQTYSEVVEDSMKRGFFDSGIGKFIKTVAPFAIPALLPTKLVAPYKMAKLGYDVKQNKGLVGQAINQALTSNLASNIRSNISTSNLTGKRSTTDTTDTREDRIAQRDERDGRQITPEAPKDVVTAGVEKFTQPQFTQPQLTELQKRQSILQGYANKGALNERGQSTLMQLNQMLEQALVSVAHGGFIDKPLMGRSRDI